MGYKNLKYYDNRAGVDSRTNEVRKPEAYARDNENSVYSNRDDIEKRRGGKIISDDGPAFGNFVLRQVDPDTLTKIDKPIGMNENGYLMERQDATLNVSYSGGATACLVRFFYDTATDEFRFRTFEDGVQDLDIAVGIGKDEGSPTDLSSLASTIDGDASYTATITGTGTIPAAYLELIKDHDLQSSDLALKAYEWIKCHTSMTNAEATITESSASGLVTEASDKINSTAHPFSDLDVVFYETTGTPIGGLENRQMYYVRNSGANDFELSLIFDGAIVDLTDDGTGDHTFTKWDFAGINTRRNRDQSSLELASFTQLNNVSYFTDGGFLWKYDGLAAYRAGLPELAENGLPPVKTGSGGSLSSGTYQYRFRYKYKDASGNILYSDYIDRTVSSVTAGDSLTWNGMIPLRRELMFPCFNANASSTQTSSAGSQWTINVSSGHNLKAGMMAVFWDDIGLFYAALKIESVTDTSITTEDPGTGLRISTTAFTGSDRIFGGLFRTESGVVGDARGNVDPGPMEVEIYRTTAGGSVFYYEASEYVADDSNSISHESTISDSTLQDNEIFSESGIFPKEPKIAKYISNWQNQLVQAGRPPEDIANIFKRLIKANSAPTAEIVEADIAATDFFYWDDTLFLEGFPKDGLHEESVYTNRGDDITGLAPNKDAFFVFKDQSMALVTGTLGLNNIQREILESDRGCISHSSIRDVQGSLVWLDANYGFQTIVAGQLPKTVGVAINNIVKENARSGATRLVLNKAVAVNYELDDKYICAIPAESESSSGDLYTNGNAKICVLDYAEYDLDKFRMAWHYWSGVDMSGGLYVIDNELFWSSRRYSSDLSSMKYEHWKQSNLGDAWDYQDHDQAIAWSWWTAFFRGSEPSIDKTFNNLVLKCATDTSNESFAVEVEQYGNYEPDRLLGEYSKTFTKVAQSIKKNLNFPLVSQKLESTSFKFKNSQEQTNVSISGFEVFIEGEFDTEYRY